MSTVAIVILVAIAGLSAAGHYLGWNLPNQYRRRSCQGRAWRREFSASSNNEIREFLSIFAKGFAFRARDRLKFEPSDQLLQIYRAIYPS